MTRHRYYISITVSAISVVLMMLAIVAIVVFQAYWLRKNYKDEQQNLALRTNVLFHETAQHLLLEKIGLDIDFQAAVPADIGNATYQSFRTQDSTDGKRKMGSVLITLKKGFRMQIGDSSYSRIDTAITVRRGGIAGRVAGMSATMTPAEPAAGLQFRRTGPAGERILQLLSGIDSLQDSVRVKEVADRYRQVLEKEKIPIGFQVTRTPAPINDTAISTRMAENNIVTIGFKEPFNLELELQGKTGYILRKLTTQILVSVILVTLTIFSFVLMYRNMIRHKKLTQLKNDFISNITHELKTPIATVSVAIEALRNFNALHDPARTEEYLEISAGELQRLSLLVDKVLKLSIFEKQQIEIKSEAFDLKELVEEVVSSMRLQFEKYRAKVNIQVHGESFKVKADRLHLSSVIYNLLDNALKYSKANPSIQVDLAAALPAMVELSVTDNGIGIPPEYKDKIFDKFFRVPSGDTHNVKGYGLGLSYVAYIVHRHKGTIDVESQPSIGTRLTIKLPMHA